TKMTSGYLTVSTNLTTGTSQPLSLPDATFTQSPDGSTNGAGVAGVVGTTFASSGAEVGTGSNQGGLGTAASSTQPYNATDFPGRRWACYLTEADGNTLVLSDVLLSAIGSVDANQPVVGFLSFRSDLGANLKWRLWFYYRRSS